ncbi:MAG: immunity 22 family protein [Verrucomicrobiota bacterium]
MRENGFVTLWLGQSSSAGALNEYVQLQYSDDGELIPSQLMRDFGIPSYDEDFREAERLGCLERSIRALLRGFSYDAQIIEKFAAICGEQIAFDANAVVLLYNFRIENPQVISAGTDAVQLRYMGVTDYYLG